MRSRGNQFWWIALFLAPNLCGFAVFMLVPVLLSLLMAFTNWSLKPAMQFEFVGLRNFTDLLLVRPLQTPQSNVLIPYLIAVLFGMAGLMLAVWANIAHWHGRRWGSAGLAVLGALLAVGGIAAGAGQGLMLAGALLLSPGTWAAACWGRCCWRWVAWDCGCCTSRCGTTMNRAMPASGGSSTIRST
jgi:hypothetical protein